MRIFNLIIIFLFAFLAIYPKNAHAASINTSSNLKVAFIGDSGFGTGFRQVLELIKREGAEVVVHLGDFGYEENDPATPGKWKSVIDSVLGQNFAYVGVIGNHDAPLWNSHYKSMLMSYDSANSTLNCTGDYGINSVCKYEGLNIVLSAIGTTSSNDTQSHVNYLRNQLESSDHVWNICGWHKNQHEMQVGTQTSQTGWGVYNTCLDLGAIIATAHEHSYSRTRTLDRVNPPRVSSQYSSADNLRVEPGKTFAFITGIGGHSIRPQSRCLPTSFPYGCDNVWGSIYTSSQNATYGALFIEFNVNQNPRQARGYFKNINNQTIDSFNITNGHQGAGSPPPPPPSPSSSPTPAPRVGDANGDGKVDGRDYTVWVTNFDKTISGGASVGDFNNSGKVDGVDYTYWLNNYDG